MRLSNVKKKEIFMPAPFEAFTIAMLYKEKKATEKATAGYQAAVLLSSSVASHTCTSRTIFSNVR
jgi:hypothetical protein